MTSQYPIMTSQYPIMTKQKCCFFLEMFANLLQIKTEIWHLHKYSDPLLSNLLEHPWKRLQPWVFLGMTLQAWQTSIWGVSPILHCGSSQALSGWMGVSLNSYFQVSPEMLDWVQVRALAGPPKDIQRLVPKPLLHCLGCVLRVVVLLEGEPSPQSEVLSTL